MRRRRRKKLERAKARPLSRYMIFAKLGLFLHKNPIEIEDILGDEIIKIEESVNNNPERLYSEIIPELNKRLSIKKLSSIETRFTLWRRGDQRRVESEVIRGDGQLSLFDHPKDIIL